GKSTTVSITGTNFETGVTTGVSFGAGITVTSFSVTNATTISAVLNIPTTAAGGVRDVSVTNASPGGGTVTKTGGFTVTIPVSVEGDGSVIPENFVLEDAYPNPFNPTTTIRFGLPERSSVAIRIYDVSGRVVADLVNAEMQAGMFQVQWNAASVSSGTYLVRMSAASSESGKTFSTSKKVSLVK
ncbi:MAG: T9SS type A sorting domain-containing protein, partial [Ignavibacteriales bacterium]|nr:T9SS type A sorting domain-containing protein [Ignavibacteriales bacterium]